MRRSSLTLMLLPAIGLAAYGAWMMRQPKVGRVPGLYIESIELVPVTGRDLSEGYDGRAKVVLGYMGRGPAWWGKPLITQVIIDPVSDPVWKRKRPVGIALGAAILSGNGRDRRVLGSVHNGAVWMGGPEWEKGRLWRAGRYVSSCRFKVKGMSTSRGDVRLSIAAGLPGGRILHKDISLSRPGLPDSSAQRTEETHVEILKTGVRTLTPTKAAGFGECEVWADVRYTGSGEPIDWIQYDFVVEDSRGRKWTYSELNSGLRFGSLHSAAASTGPEARRPKLFWQFSLRKLPPGRAVFRSRVGIGERRPAQVTVYLRTGRKEP